VTVSTYGGQFLRINLTTAEKSWERVPEKVQEDFLGGRGFGIKYLYDEVSAGIDPLGPDNKLLLLNGPLGGTKAQFCSKWMAYTKSPQTGTVMRAVGGGDFGAWLKWAGLDFIIIEGRAEEPVYACIEDGNCELRAADELWGKDTAETQAVLSGIHGDNVRIACIGPAGENLVLYSVIASGQRTASRGGVGAVMGSKNLKAVVIKAENRVRAYNPDGFDGAVKELVEA
jgi:aldehyde:ferredoxin oxidoreductase